MSIGALNWALEAGEAHGLNSTQRFVLIMLGNRADEEGYLYPSVQWICRHTGLDRRTVQRTIKWLETKHLIRRDSRHDDEKGQTSNAYWLALRQPGLPLGEAPHASHAAGGRHNDAGEGAAQRAGGGGTAPPKTKDLDIKEKPSGQSPAAKCSEAYRHGIKARYGAEYPPSAKLNGIMAALVRDLGADAALEVVKAYMADTDKWYVLKRHALEFLKRDAATIWIRLQERTGGAAGAAATKAIVFNEVVATGQQNMLKEYPVDEPERVARRALQDFGAQLARWGTKTMTVQIGARRHPFSIAELRP